MHIRKDDLVEVLPGLKDPHEELPGRCTIPWLKFTDGEVRTKCLAVIR